MLDSHASASLPRRRRRRTGTALRKRLYTTVRAWAAWFSGRLPLDVDVCSGAFATGAGDDHVQLGACNDGPDGVRARPLHRRLWDNKARRSWRPCVGRPFRELAAVRPDPGLSLARANPRASGDRVAIVAHRLAGFINPIDGSSSRLDEPRDPCSERTAQLGAGGRGLFEHVVEQAGGDASLRLAGQRSIDPPGRGPRKPCSSSPRLPGAELQTSALVRSPKPRAARRVGRRRFVARRLIGSRTLQRLQTSVSRSSRLRVRLGARRVESGGNRPSRRRCRWRVSPSPALVQASARRLRPRGRSGRRRGRAGHRAADRSPRRPGTGTGTHRRSSRRSQRRAERTARGSRCRLPAPTRARERDVASDPSAPSAPTFWAPDAVRG